MLQVVDLWKSYESKPLLSGVSFAVGEGETVCLLGPSGSGKSTLLRLIAGLEEPEGGRILWRGNDLAGIPTHKRRFGLMFQDYALFPHRNVAANVAFGLRMQGIPQNEISGHVKEALEMVDMAGFAQRRVTDLSGGEQQRVALARALAPRPRLLMLDEPLGALDRTLREELLAEVRRVLHQTGIPALYVTHDQEEAFTVADRIVVLHDGRIEQDGPPAELFARPASAWMAQFFGLGNILQGRVVSLEPLVVQTPLGELKAGCRPPGLAVGSDIALLLRPEGARLADNPPDGKFHPLTARVVDVAFRGGSYWVTLEAGGQRLRLQASSAPQVGEERYLDIAPGALLCLPG